MKGEIVIISNTQGEAIRRLEAGETVDVSFMDLHEVLQIAGPLIKSLTWTPGKDTVTMEPNTVEEI